MRKADARINDTISLQQLKGPVVPLGLTLNNNANKPMGRSQMESWCARWEVTNELFPRRGGMDANEALARAVAEKVFIEAMRQLPAFERAHALAAVKRAFEQGEIKLPHAYVANSNRLNRPLLRLPGLASVV